MNKLKSVVISVVFFCVLFFLMTSSLYVYEACKKNKEKYYRQICVKDVLKNYDINNGVDSKDCVWGYVITEMTVVMEEASEFHRDYIMKVYRMPYKDENGEIAIDYYIGGIDNRYCDMDLYKTEYIE